MPTEKIDDFLICYFDTFSIENENVRKLIKEGLNKRYATYKDVYPTVKVEQDTYKNYAIKSRNGAYPLEDFLLNRLFQSLRRISEISDETCKQCEYLSKNRTIYIAESAIRNSILSKISSWPKDAQEKLIEMILSTVFDHELGHALKTQFQGGYKVKSDMQNELQSILLPLLTDSLGEQKSKEILSSLEIDCFKSSDELYRELLVNLSRLKGGLYAPIIRNPHDLIDDYSIDAGTGIDKPGEAETTRLTLLDELLQETEAMEDNPFFNIPAGKRSLGPSSNYNAVYHIFSGYSPIIGYGKIMTSLLGRKGTFEATYLNPNPVLRAFDESYYEISKDIFQNELSPIENIEHSLKKIMDSRIEKTYLQLDLFFARCYEQMIAKKIIDANIDANTVLEEISSFQAVMTKNEDEKKEALLPHNVIFNDIVHSITSYKKDKSIN